MLPLRCSRWRRGHQALELPYQSVVGLSPARVQEGYQEGVGDSHSIKVKSPGAATSHEHPIFIAAREWVSPAKWDMGRAPIPSTELLIPGNKGSSTFNPDQSCDHPISEHRLALSTHSEPLRPKQQPNASQQTSHNPLPMGYQSPHPSICLGASIKGGHPGT